MSEAPREFGRDGVSGLVDRDRSIRARLLPRRVPDSVARTPQRLADKDSNQPADATRQQ